MIQTTQPIRPLRQRMLEDMTLRKLSTLRQFEPTTVVMEACYTSHPWGRAIQALGHTVKLIPPYQ
ncbi:MAG: hypothetical protein KZQ89_16185, partial [Candidatus Thiodiazotropha sp. (ex Lucinoma kastoroae)]|nr:hypothetical protein [Candidatus Thiodiazotropha sp. (ex Lucinoma kastoroae)]